MRRIDFDCRAICISCLCRDLALSYGYRRAAHRFGTQGGAKKGMPWVCRRVGSKGTVVATSSVVCCKVYKLASTFLSAPPCCCSGPFLITSFAKQKTKKGKKGKKTLGTAAKKGKRGTRPNQKLVQMPWFGFGLRVSHSFFYTLQLHASLL